MTALAVMAALIGAMFIALQSTAAAGACRESGGVITLGFGQTCEITQKGADAVAVTGVTSGAEEVAAAFSTETDEVAGTDGATVIITAASAVTTSSATVTITEYGTDNAVDDPAADPPVSGTAKDTTTTYTVNVAGLGITKTELVGDRDNVISAGPQVTARVTVRSPSDDAEVRVTVPTTGLSLQSTATGTAGETTQSITTDLGNISDTTAPNTDATDGVVVADFVVNTAGAPDGEYVITFTVDNDGFEAGETVEEGERVTDTLTISVGDPGMGIGSATLSLGNSAEDIPYTADNEAVAEDDTEPASNGDINLVVEVFDANGDKANNGSINQLIVIAPGGRITTTHNTGAGAVDTPTKAMGSSSVTLNEVDATPTGDAAVGDVGQRTVITISKADKKPGMVTVYAIVSGSGGAARTDDITLVFSGPATSLTVHDATESLLSVNPVGDNPATTTVVETDHVTKDTIKLQVTAEDVSGNNATPPTGGVTIVITDPDGKRVNRDKIDFTQPTKDGTKYLITLTGQGTAAAPLKAGNYTLKATQGKLSATATFAVAGAANDVAVTASSTSSDTIGDVITVTATVTDKDGNTVSDGTMVVFSVSEDTGLAAIGTGHKGKATKDGSASVKFAVVSAGHSVVSAEAGDATGVIVISSTAGSPPVVEVEPDPALDSISVEVVGEDHSAGRITVLASLADADGEPVEGMVSFYSSGDASLFGPVTVVTSDGTATAVYDANDDFTVLATSGGLRASVSIAVTSAAEQAAADQAEADRIAAEEAEAQAERDRIAAEEAAAEAEAERMAEEAEAERIAATVTAETERLSGVSGFTSWLAEGSTTASALFTALSAEGATALHVWNGTSWVRYSVVDGTTVPGSVDFDIERGDVLFISN